MADDVSAEKVFDYICGSGGFVKFSFLLKHLSPLGSRKSTLEAKNWLKSQADRRLVVVKDSSGEIAGVRIDLRRKICQQYLDKGSCRSAQGKCKFWHICKEFIEGNCSGKCSRSHNFFDHENQEKIKKLGLDKHPNRTIKNIVVWSLPQICERYTKDKCLSDTCLYLHLCSQANRSSSCNCSLSHNITDSHNKTILKQYDLVPHQSMSTDFVRYNILVPKEQRVIEDVNKFSPEVGSTGQTPSNEALGVTQDTKPSPEVSTPSKHETTKSPRKTTGQSSPDNLPNSSKEVDCGGSLQGKAEFKKKNCQPNLLQEKTTKAEPTCKQIDRFNNLTSNAVSPSESGLEFLNIQTREDSDSSSDENKSAKRSTKAVRCKDDKKNSVEESSQANDASTQRGESAVDAVKVDGLKEDLRKKQLENKLDGNAAKKRQQESKTIDSSKKDPKGDQSQKKPGGSATNKQQKESKAKIDRVVQDPASSKVSNKQRQKSLEASRDTKGSQSQHEPLKSANKEFVEAWLTNGDFVVDASSSCTDSPRLRASQDVEPGRQRKLSVSSSCSSVQSSHKNAPSKKAVFDCIVKEYNGTVSFDVIAKRQDLFRNGCEDIAKWFGRRKESFLIREKEGIIYDVSVVCRKARLCFKEKCSQKNCQYIHVCREYIAGFCRRGVGCQRNHSFQYDQDRKLMSKLNLDGMTEEQLRKVFQLSSPQVCLDYNDGSCREGLSCGQVHICKDFIKKRCENEEDCGLRHESAFAEAHTAAILQNYGMTIRDSNFNSVLRTLLVCESINSSSNDHKGITAAKDVAGKENKKDPPMPSQGRVSVVTKEPSEVKIFECLCKDYGCSASFSMISKRTDLFPPEFKDVGSWFYSKKGSFLITEDDHGKITQVDAFSTKARLCLSYNSGHYGECRRGNCSYLHVCREYITNSCNNGATCPRNHHFQDERDKALLSKVKLDQLTDEQVRKLVLSSTPQICVEYNNGLCDRGESCSKIHMCKDHLKRCYREGFGCRLVHEAAMNTEHTQEVLERYQMSRLKFDLVKKIILVCDQYEKSTCTKEKNLGHILLDKRDTPICPEFILSKCKNGSKCTGHHCFLPHHWQYTDAGEWKSFNEKDNEKLEKLYCDVTLEECSVTGLQISFESDGFLFLDEIYDVDILLDNKLLVIQKDFERFAQLRRLSTDSYVNNSSNPLATEWIWYWQDENGFWRMYAQDNTGKDLQGAIEKAFLKKENDFKFRIADQDYILSFDPSSDMSQTNVKYGTTKKVRRRPGKVVSKEDISQLKRSQKAVPGNNQQERNARSTNTPSHWSLMPSTRKYQRVPLSRVSEEFKDVERLFKKSIKRSTAIIGIERVQNPFMWEKYQRKKENMAAVKTGSTKGRFVDERQLFHGTSPEIVEAICKQNFDWRLHGRNATVYGEGSYFALNSYYSDSYAKEDSKGSKFMFVAKVLVGLYTTGDSSYRRPPSKNPSDPASDLYDSCVNDRSCPTIFVVFDTDQFYPEYIIEYSAARGGYQQPAARAPVPKPRRPQATVAPPAAVPKAHYNFRSPSTSYQTPTSSSTRVQAAYSGVSRGTSGYPSTFSATHDVSAYNYSPTARATQYTPSRYTPTASTTTSHVPNSSNTSSYAYSGASSRCSPSLPSTRSSSPTYQPKKHQSSPKCSVM